MSVLPHEMMTIEPGENPTCTLTWKSLAYLIHIKSRTNDDLFPLPLMGDLVLYQIQSEDLQVHDSVVYKLGALLGSVGHKVKIHKITPATGKERGDIEIKDYVVLQKPQSQDNRLPPPRTLIMDFTMTHVRFGRPHLHPIGQLSHTRRSDGAPDPDGDLQEVVRI